MTAESEGRPADAEIAYRNCLRLTERPGDRLVALANLVQFLVRYERSEEALRHCDELESLIRHTPLPSRQRSIVLNSLATAYLSSTRPAKAVPVLEQALEDARQAGMPASERVDTESNLAMALLASGKPGDADLVFSRIVTDEAASPFQRAIFRTNRAQALSALNRHDAAIAEIALGLSALASLPEAQDSLLKAHNIAAGIYRDAGRRKSAKLHEREAERVAQSLRPQLGSRRQIDIRDLARNR